MEGIRREGRMPFRVPLTVGCQVSKSARVESPKLLEYTACAAAHALLADPEHCHCMTNLHWKDDSPGWQHIIGRHYLHHPCHHAAGCVYQPWHEVVTTRLAQTRLSATAAARAPAAAQPTT